MANAMKAVGNMAGISIAAGFQQAEVCQYVHAVNTENGTDNGKRHEVGGDRGRREHSNGLPAGKKL